MNRTILNDWVDLIIALAFNQMGADLNHANQTCRQMTADVADGFLKERLIRCLIQRQALVIDKGGAVPA